MVQRQALSQLAARQKQRRSDQISTPHDARSQQLRKEQGHEPSAAEYQLISQEHTGSQPHLQLVHGSNSSIHHSVVPHIPARTVTAATGWSNSAVAHRNDKLAATQPHVQANSTNSNPPNNIQCIAKPSVVHKTKQVANPKPGHNLNGSQVTDVTRQATAAQQNHRMQATEAKALTYPNTNDSSQSPSNASQLLLTAGKTSPTSGKTTAMLPATHSFVSTTLSGFLRIDKAAGKQSPSNTHALRVSASTAMQPANSKVIPTTTKTVTSSTVPSQHTQQITGQAAPPKAGSVSEGMAVSSSNSAAATSSAYTGLHDEMMDPEELRRHARRQHRKRVAQIVVDHWKAHAADRLKAVRACRHYHHRLLGAALVALQTQVAGAAAAWRLAAVHAAKHSFLLLAQCLKEWMRFAKSNLRLKLMSQELSGKHMQRLKHSMLLEWQAWQQSRLTHRRQQVQADYYLVFITLTKCLRKWRLFASQHISRAADTRVARLHYAHLLKKHAVAGWRQEAEYQQRKAAQWQSAIDWDRERILRQCLPAWLAAARLMAAVRTDATQLLHAARHGWLQEAAKQAFIAWKGICVRKKQHASLLHQAQHRQARRRLRSCLHAWEGWARNNKEFRIASGMMAVIGRRWHVQLCWHWWYEAVEVAQGLRSEEMRWRVVCKACIRVLQAYVHRHHSRRQRIHTCQAAARVRLLHAVLQGWRHQAMRLRRKAIRWHVAVTASRLRTLQRALQGLHARAAYHRAKASMWVAAVMHSQTTMLKLAWRALHVYTKWQHVKHDIAVWAARKRAVSVLSAWAALTAEKLMKQRQWRTAVRHRYLTLVSRGVLAFRLAIQRAEDKHALYTRMSAHRCKTLMAQAFSAWARAFLPLAAEQRARAATAALVWRDRMLRTALSGWQHESARLAIKHRKQREATAFAIRHMLARTFNMWQHGIHAQQERRDRKWLRLHNAQLQLDKQVKMRLFRAWRDVHVRLVQKQFQVAKAQLYAHQLTCTRAIHAWKQAMERSRLRSLAIARARLLWTSTCCNRVWTSWRGLVEARHAKQRANDMATKFCVRSLQSRGLQALRWYNTYRKHKAHDMQQALAMYTRSLQQEGVRQWLEVGLHKRQQRLQGLASKQAQTLAKQLALVEPYARHWRRITQQRALQCWVAKRPPGWLPPPPSYFKSHTSSSHAITPSSHVFGSPGVHSCHSGLGSSVSPRLLLQSSHSLQQLVRPLPTLPSYKPAAVVKAVAGETIVQLSGTNTQAATASEQSQTTAAHNTVAAGDLQSLTDANHTSGIRATSSKAVVDDAGMLPVSAKDVLPHLQIQTTPQNINQSYSMAEIISKPPAVAEQARNVASYQRDLPQRMNATADPGHVESDSNAQNPASSVVGLHKAGENRQYLVADQQGCLVLSQASSCGACNAEGTPQLLPIHMTSDMGTKPNPREVFKQLQHTSRVNCPAPNTSPLLYANVEPVRRQRPAPRKPAFLST